MNDEANKDLSIEASRKSTDAYLNRMHRESFNRSDIEKLTNPAYESNQHLKQMTKDIATFNQTTADLAEEIKNIKSEMAKKDIESKQTAWKIALFSIFGGAILAKILDILFT